ncbi:hypothetical protein F5Y03DRAFT_409173 [Xylaria venustula]|nr:hypothetical protein F5Y03DRAFT_409173 [Xylaria venustula]
MRHACLLVLLSLFSLGLQSSSTILFADLAPGRLIDSPRQLDYTYDLNYQWNKTTPLAQIGGYGIYDTIYYPSGLYTALFQSAWTQRPKTIPVFGEYRQSLTSPSGVDDSGYVFTSFLPFDSSTERTSIAKFEGPAWVLDSRVSCQKPHFLGINNVQAPARYAGDVLNPLWYSFIGTLENSTEVEGPWFPTNASREIPFDCQFKYIPRPAGDSTYWANGVGFHVCQLQGLDTMIQFPDDNKEGKAVLQATESAGSLRSRLHPYNVTDSFPARGPAFLVIASNLTLNQNQTSHEAFTKLSFLFNPPHLVDENAVQDVFFSLCFTSWDSTITHVEMATSSPLEEPSIEVKDGLLDLSAALHHYGVGNLSDSRAIFSLQQPHYNMSLEYPIQQPATDRFISKWDFDTLSWGTGYIMKHQHSDQIKSVPDDEYDFKFLPLFDSWKESLGNITVLFQYYGVGPNDDDPGSASEATRRPDPSYQTFFTNAMNKTNNSPALSLSALLTFVSSSAYYEQFPIFTKKGTGQVTLFVNVSYPHSKMGLTAVITMIIGHWLVCFIVLYLFLSTSKFSRLGDAWANVAQIYGSATRGIIDNATLASDRDVKELLARREHGRRRVTIKKVCESKERVEAVLTTETGRSLVQEGCSRDCGM